MNRFQMPPALAIVASVVLLAAFATIVLPKGEYQRTERNFPNWIPYTVVAGDTIESIAKKLGAEAITVADLRAVDGANEASQMLEPGNNILVPVGGMVRSAVVPNSYQSSSDQDERAWWEVLLACGGSVACAPILGFIDKAQIIGFVLLLGGAFGVILSTGAIDQGLQWGVLKLGDGGAKMAVVPVSFLLFSLAGSVFGMGEDTIAFVLITVPLALRLGYDTITGVAMCYMASQVGFAGAFFNPFTVGIAQGIAELPYLSGLNYRYVIWTVVTLIGIVFTMAWAERVKKDPKLSPTFEMDEIHRRKLSETSSDEAVSPTLNQWLVMAVAFGSVFISGVGVAEWGWFINEMAALFIVCGLICGALSRYSLKRMSEEFVRGTEMMVEPALIIACSAGIVIVLRNGLVLDTILCGLAAPLEAVSPGIGSVAMMCFQAVLNFFVPSGSGQAAMTMPLVTPLCDLIGLHRQVGVLAFQFGDGFGNLMVPTSAVLMGVLGAAKISWGLWIRWVAPLVIILHVVGGIFLIIATYGPQSWME